MTNRLRLSATLVGRGALRYTPAGLPAVDLTLRHDGATMQLGQTRQLRFEVHAKAVGPVAEQLLIQALGSEGAYEGFLGAHRNGRGIVFHVDAFALTRSTDPT